MHWPKQSNSMGLRGCRLPVSVATQRQTYLGYPTKGYVSVYVTALDRMASVTTRNLQLDELRRPAARS